MIKMKSNKVNNELLLPSILGSAAAAIIALTLTLICALFINNEYIDIKFSTYLAPPIAFISVFLGSLITGKLFRMPAYFGFIVSGVTVLLSCTIAFLFFDGIKTGVILTVLCSLIAAILYLFICKKGRIPHKSMHFRRRTR